MLATPVLSTALWAGDAWIGTWKLNHAKSDAYAKIPKSQILTFAAQGNALKTTEHITNAEGVAYSVHWTASYDGKDYPVTGSRAGAELVWVRRVDAQTFEGAVKKKDGTVVGIYKVVVSPDGKFLTMYSQPGPPAPDKPPRVRFFDRQ